MDNISSSDKRTLENLENFYKDKIFIVDRLNVYSDDIDYIGSGIRVIIEDNRVKHISISFTESNFWTDDFETLEFFTSEIYKLSELTHLQLIIHNFTKQGKMTVRHASPIPIGIKNLKKLESCSLYSSDFSQLPDDIGYLTNLRYLNIADTSLSSFPESFYRLKNLRKLVTARCDIPNDTLDEVKLKIPQLQKLVTGKYYNLYDDKDV